MGSGIDVIELNPSQIGFDEGIPVAAGEALFYGSADAVAAGNLDIISGFNPQLFVFGARGSARDGVQYDDALRTDVYWYNDAGGDLLMANSDGIFAKFLGVSAADMNDAFTYV
jgi:hypothetical protein